MAGIKVLNIKTATMKYKIAGVWSEWFDPEQGNQTVGDDYNQRPKVFNFVCHYYDLLFVLFVNYANTQEGTLFSKS